MNYLFLENADLFKGLKANEIKKILCCFDAYKKFYKKDEIIYLTGDKITNIGLIESGSINIVVNFYCGNSNIFAHMEKGEIFGETYAVIQNKEIMYDVVAVEDSIIIFFNINKFFKVCKTSCHFHQRIVYNLIRIIAKNNINLSNRMIHTASKSIRQRLISYFSEQVKINGNNNFIIPFSRQQLSDYLGVDRSALSNELSKMQKEGLIIYNKNSFRIIL